MAQLVFIREIYSRSFLYFTTNGDGYCLRDFSLPGAGPAVELERQSEGRTATTIREMARELGNLLVEVAGQGKGTDEYAFWHQQTTKLNEQYLEPKPPQAPLPGKSWILENIATVAGGVISAVLIAAILAWLGLKP